ncbi:hypothetical protein [Streptacidiphilus fuscans]|uniref:Uncharacterized protein n=1 Tax=Streptacidiphilus fuscans TaxID=2789292 RepID=A0A931BA89_9ACTN|nr:hypothetical protein [Streptacidiphilus fuscans]MBF9071896.1 hypothetical protein [Streptacidiphilus fuscans]
MALTPQTPPEPKGHPSSWRTTLGRYGRAALRNAVNGAGYAAGAGTVGLLFWWLQR